MYTLAQTINWAQTYIQYEPLTAGTNLEPAMTIASMVRNTILNAPFTWPWNRNEYAINTPNSPASLSAGVQDYTFNIADFAYLEKVSLLSADGTQAFEIQDCYNTNILGLAAPSSQAQPNAAAVKSYTPGTSVALRFLSIPDQAYTGIITYQKLAVPFQGFAFEAVNVVSTVAYYLFSVPQTAGASNGLAGQTFQVTGFDMGVNNGSFVCTASTSSYVILTNPSAVTDVVVTPASGIIGTWFPIPDSFMDIFNNLFLAEAMASADDGREQLYRTRGIAALLSKAEGLTAMQINSFLAQYLSRGMDQTMAAQQRTQQGGQGRGV